MESKAKKAEMPANKIVIVVNPSTTTADGGKHVGKCGGEITKSGNTSARKSLLRMSDVLVSVTILLTISIGFWRGVWQIADFYCLEYGVGHWTAFGVNTCILFLLYYFQENLQTHIHPNKMNFLSFYILTRTLLLIHGLAFVNQWRGLWEALNDYLKLDVTFNVLTFIIPILIAIPLKIFSNFLATPLYVGVDDANTIHSCQLRFNTQPEQPVRYFLDCFFSLVIVQTLTIISWRGLWCLADVYIYPDDLLSSAVVCWLIGNSIVAVLSAIQPFYFKKVSKLKGISRLVIVNIVTLIGFVGCVLGWRGCWELFNTLLIFETNLRSEWVTTIFGAVAALLLGCLSTVVNRGALTDGEVSADGSSDWNVSYISLLESRDEITPFPEPWLLRYFCTNQEMNVKKRRNMSRSTNNMNEYGEAMKPLNRSSDKNTIHPILDCDFNCKA